MSKKEELTIDLTKVVQKIKKIKFTYILLLAFIIFGFYLRAYNIDFPSIGYHNMKENEYLCEAKYFYDTDSDFFRRVICINGISEGPGYFEEYPQMPILPWLFYIMWNIFGVHFWTARIIIILFSLSTIWLMYLITKELTNNEYISLVSAFLATIMPLNVFFGRNIQPETPALACLMVGIYFYLRWVKNFRTKDIILMSIGFMFAALFKYTFLIGVIPLIFIFPFNKIIKILKSEKRNNIIKQIIYFVLIMLIPLIWIWITNNFLNVIDKGDVFGGTFGRISLFRVFTSQYWQEFWPTLRAYGLDNWTIWFFWFTVIAGIFLLFKYKTKISKFIIGYFIALIPYGMVLADYIKGHSYYQMPFIPLVCIASAYLIYLIGSLLKQFFKIKYLQYAAILLLIPIIPQTLEYTNRQYDAIFYGLDVAGQYIKENSNQNERFFFSGHSQTVGVCFNADRRCDGLEGNLSRIKYGEDNLNFNWVFIHGDNGMYNLQKYSEVWDYVQENYKIAQIGFFQTDKGAAPQYYVLKKGGKFNLTEIQTKQVRLGKVYETKHGKRELYVVENEI